MSTARQGLMLAAAALAGALTASGSSIYYDRATWEAVTLGEITIDFEGLAASGSFIQYSQPPGLTLSGVNFTSPSDPGNGPAALYVIDPGVDPLTFDWGSGAILDAQAGVPTQILVTLPAGITALGADLLSPGPGSISPPDFNITLSTGESFTVSTAAQPQRTFVGFTSDVPITSILFTPQLSGSDAALDNFSFGIAAPEPGSFGLMVLAGTIGCFFRRRVA